MKTSFQLNLIHLLALSFMNVSAAMAATTPTGQLQAPDSFTYEQRRDSVTPQLVLQWLKAGNERFASGRSTHGNYPVDSRLRIAQTKDKQLPLAAVLSCIDSRNTPELVFDTAVGDLFTARVGANVINEDILGSLEFGSNVKVLVVLGHTDCAGVMAACNHDKLPHMDRLLNYVRKSIPDVNLDQYGPPSCENHKYVDELSHQNALNGAKRLLSSSRIIREREKQGKLIVVSAMYDVSTGKVTFENVP